MNLLHLPTVHHLCVYKSNLWSFPSLPLTIKGSWLHFGESVAKPRQPSDASTSIVVNSKLKIKK